MTREYEPAPTTKAAQKHPQKNVEDRVRILGLRKTQWSQFAAENPSAPTAYPHFAECCTSGTGVFGERHDRVSVLTDPDGRIHIQTCDLSDVRATRLPRSAEPCGCETAVAAFISNCTPAGPAPDGRGLLNQVGQDNHHSLITRFLDQHEISAPIPTQIPR
jgi:hypothetical protein